MIIEKQVIVNPTDKQLNDILGLANNEFGDNVKKNLMSKDKKDLEKAFKDIHPFCLLTNINKNFSKLQIDILVSKDIESSLKKQAIEKISFLTLQDIELLKIIKNIY